MTAIEVLSEQHEEVLTLLKKLGAAKGTDRTTLRDRLASVLWGHVAIEEEPFLPALEDEDETREFVADAFHELDELRTALAELERCDVDHPEFPQLVRELEDNVVHHAADMEKELFPRVEDLWTSAELEEVGLELVERYRMVTSEAAANHAE